MAKCNLLFTYGTLMSGERLNPCLNGAPLRGSGVTAGELQTFNGAYPIALPNPSGLIHGEIYEVADAATWAMLDRVEQGYRRHVTTIISNGKRIPAYMYWYTDEWRGKIISSGSWKNREESN